MIQAFKLYPTYKDSGVPWLGNVPEHWEIRKQRQVVKMLVSNVDKHSLENEKPVRLCNYVDVYKNERITKRLNFMRATATKDEIDCFRLREGDVLITKDSEGWNDIGVPALVEYTADDLICGYHLAILRPNSEQVIGEYLLRAIQSQGVASQYYISANGVTRYGLTHQSIKNVQIPIPPLPEQHAIVRFLAYADRRINRYIRAKRKLIILLNEQKQVIIHHAVTRGLDPNVRLKPSGVEWLGDVPEHWEVRRVKTLFRLRIEKSGTDHGKELLSIYTHIGVRPRKDLEEKGNKASTTDDYWIVKKGDIICNKLLAWMGAIGVSHYDGVTSPAYDILMPIVELSPDYFHLIFRTKHCLQEFKQRSRGIMDMRLRLYFDQFGTVLVPMPPPDEQRKIVEYYDKVTTDIDTAITRAEREIDLLREFRTRLIADVVTGKLDVRKAAMSLPEEHDDFAAISNDGVDVIDEFKNASVDDFEEVLEEGMYAD